MMKSFLEVFTVMLCVLQLSTTLSHAQGRFFSDDFDDGDPHDLKPANWQRGTWSGGDLFVEDKDLYVTDCLPGECAIAPQNEAGSWLSYDDVSMRLQARVTDGIASIVPWNRWAASHDTAYFGFVRSETGVVAVGGKGNIEAELDLLENASDQDVILKVDFIGNETSATAWAAGSEPAEMPVLSFRDDELTFGIAGVSLFPRGGEPASVVYRWIEFAEILPGDVDTNSVIDVADIDHLSAGIRLGLESNRYDVNQDGGVNADDRQSWITQIKRTWIGDSNLDGEFNSSDFVAVFQTGEYEDDLAENSTWATGDWNGDAEFDSTDFVFAFQEGGYEKGPRRAVVVVPEPSSCLILLIAALAIMFRRRR